MVRLVIAVNLHRNVELCLRLLDVAAGDPYGTVSPLARDAHIGDNEGLLWEGSPYAHGKCNAHLLRRARQDQAAEFRTTGSTWVRRPLRCSDHLGAARFSHLLKACTRFSDDLWRSFVRHQKAHSVDLSGAERKDIARLTVSALHRHNVGRGHKNRGSVPSAEVGTAVASLSSIVAAAAGWGVAAKTTTIGTNSSAAAVGGSGEAATAARYVKAAAVRRGIMAASTKDFGGAACGLHQEDGPRLAVWRPMQQCEL
jgi:hypothetical protein